MQCSQYARVRIVYTERIVMEEVNENEEVPVPVQNDERPPEVYSATNRQTIPYFVRVVVKPFVFLIVLVTLVASKVSITTIYACTLAFDDIIRWLE